MSLHGEPEGLGQMPLAYRAAGQGVANLAEGDSEPGLNGVQMVVELGAHFFDLQVGLCLHVGKHLCLLSAQAYGVVKPFSAQVCPSGVVGVVYPYACGLVFNIEGDELYIE